MLFCARPRGASPRGSLFEFTVPRLLAACLLGSVSILASGCSVDATPGDDSADREATVSGVRQREAPRVRVAPLEQREMVRRLETTTVIESEAEIELIPRTAGVVIEVFHEEGDRVQSGERLARIDDRDAILAVRDSEVSLEEALNREDTFKLAIEEAQAGIENAGFALEQAKRDFERNDRLHGGDGRELPSALSAQALEASRLELERAKHDLVKAELTKRRAVTDARNAEIGVSRAQVALQRAQLAQEYTAIRAPFAGVIASRSVRVGDTVGSEPVFVLTDTKNLRAVFFRPQRELAMFAARTNRMNGDGAPLEISARTEALPGAVFTGYIERSSPTIDAQSGSFRVTARLSVTPEQPENTELSPMRLLPGMLIRLEIVTDRHANALVVQKRAVRREGEDSFVLRVEDGMASRIMVEEGFAEDDFVEILTLEPGTLSPGDSIITVGARDLVDGAEVTVEDLDADAKPAEKPLEEPEAASADGADE